MNIRLHLLIFVMFFVAFSNGVAQFPDDGKVVENSYVNSYFKFSYTCPTILHPIDKSALNIRQSGHNGNEFLLFSAKKSNEPFGIIILAEKPNFHTQRNDGLTEGEGFLEYVKKLWDPAGKPRILSQTHRTNSDGLVFYELDYIHFGEYESAIVTQFGEFKIVFKCNAKSGDDLAEMEKSAFALHPIK